MYIHTYIYIYIYILTGLLIILRDTIGMREVSFEDIAMRYNSARHPEVLAGRLSPKIALANFLETFDGGVNTDDKVTRDEFIDYYTNISACIDSEEYFDLLLRSVWDLHRTAMNLNNETVSNRRYLESILAYSYIYRLINI
jgi:hypothetical protein